MRLPVVLERRPVTRADCAPGAALAVRPCPWTGCSAHLGRSFPNARETCTLDVVDGAPAGLPREALAELLGVPLGRIHELEGDALARLRRHDLAVHADLTVPTPPANDLAALLASKASVRSLAHRFGVTRRTIAKWRADQGIAVRAFGNVRFGYRVAPDGMRLEPHPREQEAIVMARSLREAGRSWWAISRELAGAGHVSRNGRPFEPTQLRQMLRR